MSARTRIAAVVALAALGAAAAAVGVAVVQANGDAPGAGSARLAPPSGLPPLVLDLGVRSDGEARALRRAARLYDQGRRAAAARLFARHRSLDARVGAALARWPEGTVVALERLARDHPRSALVRLNLGLALFWTGRREEAVAAWREARRVEPDSLAAVRAGDLLHPNFPRGLPVFVPGFSYPPAIAALPPERRLAALARAAAGGGPREKILYGVALQRLGRPLSARRQFDAAATLAPRDAEAQVAAAVARFDKARPARAFARLGPLARRFPESESVRFHLGLLLLWLGDVEGGTRQLELARSAAPASVLGREADRYLRRLEGVKAGRDGK